MASGGSESDEQVDEDAKIFGIKLPEKPKEEEKGCVVWEENWQTVLMFLRMQTQWAVSMSGFVGLKYEVLLGAGGLFDLYNVDNRVAMLEDLKVMEAAALKEFNKDSK